MAFINEYISEENIEKYQINELRNSYSKYKNHPKKHHRHHWTIDTEREIWFMWVGVRQDPLDHTRTTGERFFTLYYKNEHIEVVLRKVFEESSVKNIENPYYITWKLDHIKKPSNLKNIEEKEIIEVLEEALNVYGPEGMDNVDIYKIPEENIIVKLKVEES